MANINYSYINIVDDLAIIKAAISQTDGKTLMIFDIEQILIGPTKECKLYNNLTIKTFLQRSCKSSSANYIKDIISNLEVKTNLILTQKCRDEIRNTVN